MTSFLITIYGYRCSLQSRRTLGVLLGGLFFFGFVEFTDIFKIPFLGIGVAPGF